MLRGHGVFVDVDDRDWGDETEHTSEVQMQGERA